jgi:heme/copper-type cytochrome/quinol oxidase subunit 2
LLISIAIGFFEGTFEMLITGEISRLGFVINILYALIGLIFLVPVYFLFRRTRPEQISYYRRQNPMNQNGRAILKVLSFIVVFFLSILTLNLYSVSKDK